MTEAVGNNIPANAGEEEPFYRSKPLVHVVIPRGEHPVYGKVTKLTINTEACGNYLEIHQTDDSGGEHVVKLDWEEWDLVKETAQVLRGDFENQTPD
jgi:hypothetical protein